ncbi:MAG: sigma-54-dependent Fis family transcriptional regulator [Deltaproteobacteria bacterium]|nr:sigma-54-dependent Fis family transcriptional regulator [Deltaproteobacteria bacterium]
MTHPKVLVVDDKENILGLLKKILESGHDVTTVADGTRALALISGGDFDVVMSDIRMPGADGFTLLRETKRLNPDVEVILMTAYGSVAKAVEAMKEGAYDYLTKPFEPDEALLAVQRAVERRLLRQQAHDLRAALLGANRFENMVGKSAVMQKVFELMRRAAATDSTVLVTGESGTGKELVARAIHYASGRKERKFVPVNCGAIPENLMEAELFGHVKGSFTGATSDRRGLFEEAEGGTLFLDEIGELPLLLQVKLTRALQERAIRRVGSSEERRVDVRVIAATNVDLKEAVSAGRFREDLFYRLNIFPVRLPPLRQRSEDIPMLAMLFLERHAKGHGVPIEGFTPEALAAMLRYDWPGNVRELENAVERALAVSDGSRISTEALPDEVSATGGHEPTSDLASMSYRDAVDLARDRASRLYLVALMREFGGNVTAAAERAGVERESLHRLLKRYGVRSESFKS